ncbi:hypothetical protein K1719_041748 [Acacia pycnantha]|nr:hypothetical protein K1719_041748 [Acacia pycnantha]
MLSSIPLFGASAGQRVGDMVGFFVGWVDDYSFICMSSRETEGRRYRQSPNINIDKIQNYFTLMSGIRLAFFMLIAFGGFSSLCPFKKDNSL